MPATAQPASLNPRAVRAVVRALWSGVPKLTLFGDTAHAMVLRQARTGDIIEDPECDEDYEALASGIYRRYRIERSGKPAGFRWMFLCKTDDLDQHLAQAAEHIEAFEREAVAPDAAWQTIQWQDSQRRAAARQKA